MSASAQRWQSAISGKARPQDKRESECAAMRGFCEGECECGSECECECMGVGVRRWQRRWRSALEPSRRGPAKAARVRQGGSARASVTTAVSIGVESQWVCECERACGKGICECECECEYECECECACVHSYGDRRRGLGQVAGDTRERVCIQDGSAKAKASATV